MNYFSHLCTYSLSSFAVDCTGSYTLQCLESKHQFRLVSACGVNQEDDLILDLVWLTLKFTCESNLPKFSTYISNKLIRPALQWLNPNKVKA